MNELGDGLTTCKRCGERHCAWVQSKKTGRFYLADAMETKVRVGSSGNGSYRVGGLDVRPWQPHKCDAPCPVRSPGCQK